jgi:hypothetical protein
MSSSRHTCSRSICMAAARSCTSSCGLQCQHLGVLFRIMLVTSRPPNLPRRERHDPAPTLTPGVTPLLLLLPLPSQIVLDLGRQPEARFLNSQGEFLRQAPVSTRGVGCSTAAADG